MYERYFQRHVASVAAPDVLSHQIIRWHLVLCLIDEGAIDPAKLIQDYLPELRGSAFSDATVQQVLDMTNSIEFNEDYADPDADVWKYGYVFGISVPPCGLPRPASIYEYLATLKRAKRPHGEGFYVPQHRRTGLAEQPGQRQVRQPAASAAHLAAAGHRTRRLYVAGCAGRGNGGAVSTSPRRTPPASAR